MEIFTFEEQVSIPISNFGSRFKIGPLTDADSRVRVQVMHLPPGGLIGRHRATTKQLFAVVQGSGWGSGADGRRRLLPTGFAALWAEGEEHEAGSDVGLTALCVEGEFDVLAMPITQDIVVADYDPAWPDWFERIRGRVWPAVADVALRIDHVGSTAVPGLAAKPIIDLDVVVASEADVRPVIARLSEIGYTWRGNLGLEGREAFFSARNSDLPAHHLYLVVENNRPHIDHWLLRDLLREDAVARARYAELKRRNAELANRDIDVYLASKAKLVRELLTRGRAERGLPPATYREPGG
jgi:GrpB-like predicted nucleotidyltransferase (UPF0157 family)/quercetin dioxygenase-like cupin family protein